MTHPDQDGVISTLEEFTTEEVAETYLSIGETIKALKKDQEECRDIIKARMGTDKEYRFGPYHAQKVQQTRRSIDRRTLEITARERFGLDAATALLSDVTTTKDIETFRLRRVK